MEYDRLSRVFRAKNISDISWYKYNYLKEQENLTYFQEKNAKKYREKNETFDKVIDEYKNKKKEDRNFENNSDDFRKEILKDIVNHCDVYNCTLSEIKQVFISLYENEFLNDVEKNYADEIISIKEEEILDECIEAGNSALDFSILKNKRFDIIDYIKVKAEGLINIKLFLKGNEWKKLAKKIEKFSKNSLDYGGMELFNHRTFIIKK